MKKRIATTLDGRLINISEMITLDRYICTKNAPWSKDRCLWGEHPDAIEDYPPNDSGICSDVDTIAFRCPYCNYYWYEHWTKE